MLRPVKDKRQHDGCESFVIFVQLSLRWQSHVEGAELDLLRLLGRAAKYVVGEDIDLDSTAGALFNAAGKLLGRDVRRMILSGKMRKAHGQRRGVQRHVRRDHG